MHRSNLFHLLYSAFLLQVVLINLNLFLQHSPFVDRLVCIAVVRLARLERILVQTSYLCLLFNFFFYLLELLNKFASRTNLCLLAFQRARMRHLFR